jgi:hypothetical protein
VLSNETVTAIMVADRAPFNNGQFNKSDPSPLHAPIVTHVLSLLPIFAVHTYLGDLVEVVMQYNDAAQQDVDELILVIRCMIVVVYLPKAHVIAFNEFFAISSPPWYTTCSYTT